MFSKFWSCYNETQDPDETNTIKMNHVFAYRIKEYVRAYIDDLLVITRGTLEDHLEKLGKVLRRLHEAGLKINAAKLFFLYPRNRIPWLHISQRRDQSPTKESTGNTRAKSAKQCQGPKTLLRNGTILP